MYSSQVFMKIISFKCSNINHIVKFEICACHMIVKSIISTLICHKWIRKVDGDKSDQRVRDIKTRPKIKLNWVTNILGVQGNTKKLSVIQTRMDLETDRKKIRQRSMPEILVLLWARRCPTIQVHTLGMAPPNSQAYRTLEWWDWNWRPILHPER